MPQFFLLLIYTEWEILTGFSYSLKPVGFRVVSMSVLNFLTQKHPPVNFQDQRFFETEVIKEKVVFEMSAEASI